MNKLLVLAVCMLLCSVQLIVHAQTNQDVSIRNSAIEVSKEYQKGNIYQKDFLLFIAMLEETHPAFAPDMKVPFDLKKVKKAGYEWSTDCGSAKDLSNYIQSIISQLEDGHTSIIPAYDQSLRYPFTFISSEGRFYVSVIDPSYEDMLGQEIIAVNGKSFATVIERLKTQFSHDNEMHLLKEISTKIPFQLVWENAALLGPDKKLNIKLANGKNISLDAVDSKDFRISRIKPSKKIETPFLATKLPFRYQLMPDKKLCYLQFSKCADKRTVRLLLKDKGVSDSEIERRLSGAPVFSEFLDSMFLDMNNQKIRSLVIDVRGNEGGNSQLCEELLFALSDKVVLKEFVSYIRISDLLSKNQPFQFNELMKIANVNQYDLQKGKLYNTMEIHRLQSDKAVNRDVLTSKKPAFQGKVIFIQDESTYSSAGKLVTKAVDNGIGFVIGTKSTYSPSSYGDLLWWQLPNTGIKGIVSHKLFLRPDASRSEEKTLIPHVEISSASMQLEGIDACWEWVLKNIGN